VVNSEHCEFRLLHLVLGALVPELLRRREIRCQAWLTHNSLSFKDSTEASELQTTLALYLQHLDAAFQLCSSTCAHCLLPCTCVGSKHKVHSCETDHKCHHECYFCQEDAKHTELVHVNLCNEKAGHGGRHLCASTTHTCNKPCALKNAVNCRGFCSQQPDHEGDCDCGSGNHLCGVKCALPGCNNKCVEPYGSKHDRHACQDKCCPEVSFSSQPLDNLSLGA
jgi:hypothetical protein